MRWSLMKGPQGQSAWPNRLAVVAVALASVAIAGAQGLTPAQLLEGGVYLQNHYGNDDHAIQVFREVIGTGARTQAGLAQMQIVSALIHKGDLAAAAREFQTLVTAYAEQTDLMASVSKRLSGLGDLAQTPEPPTALTRGTLETVYRLKSFGVEMTLPPGWDVTEDRGADGVRDSIFVHDRKTNFSVDVFVERLAETDPAISGNEAVKRIMDAKVRERISNGVPGFAIIPDTMRAWTVHGRPALSAVAKLNWGKMDQYRYLAVICGASSYAFADGFAPETDVSAYRERVEQLIAGTKVP
jgi:hypothetical protein